MKKKKTNQFLRRNVLIVSASFVFTLCAIFFGAKLLVNNTGVVKTQLFPSGSTYMWDSYSKQSWVCESSESLQDCFDIYLNPTKAATGVSKNLAGLPSGRPDIVYTLNYNGGIYYNIAAWYGSSVYACTGDPSGQGLTYCGNGFGYVSSTDIGLPSGFTPGLAYTHDWDQNNQDATVLWNKYSSQVCIFGDMKTGDTKFTCFAPTAVGLPSGFIPEGVLNNSNVLTLFGRVSGVMKYYRAYLSSNPNSFAEINPGGVSVSAQVWDTAGGYEKTSCSGTLKSCLDTLASPSIISLAGLPDGYAPDIIYTLDWDGDEKYNVALWQGSSIYYCSQSGCAVKGFVYMDPSTSGLTGTYSGFDPDLAYTHDVSGHGKNTTIIWDGNNFCFWGDKDQTGQNDKFYCNSGTTVGLPSTFYPDDVKYNNQTKALKLYDGTVCYNYVLSSNSFTSCDHKVSGTISGDIKEGVTLTCGSYTSLSDSSGYYEITIPESTTCTLTPTKSGYTFNPTNYSITVGTSDVTGKNFTSSVNKHSVSGTISGDVTSGVTLTCGGYTATSGSGGAFTISNVPDGTSCTLTPSLDGYTFSPTTRSVNVNGADVTGQNFTATEVIQYYSVSGTVSGDTTSGVTLTCGSYTATSGSSGTFTISNVPDETTCTLTPSKTGYTFSPTTRSVNVNDANVTGQNFTATVVNNSYSVSGTVSGDTTSGVTLTCGSYTATSGSSGTFTISNVPDETTCTLTPSKTGYTFSPTTRSVNVNGANVTGQNFTASKVAATCGTSNQDIASPADQFNSSDFNDYERIYLGLKSGTKRDVNGDGTTNYTDVAALFQCLLCGGDWNGCSL